MRVDIVRVLVAVVLISGIVLALTSAASADPSVVRAVLFYSETCPHCREVVEHILPPIQKKYGRQLALLMLETFDPANARILYATQDAFALPPERQGVPTLVIGDTVLVGTDEIQARLTAEIDRYLAAGGVDYPDLPGLAAVTSSSAEPQTTPTRTGFTRDPVANSVAITVLAGMVAALAYLAVAGVRVARGLPGPQVKEKRWGRWIIPILAVIGLAVSSYLTWVKLAHVRPICGPVGNCDAVQSSAYAEVAGVPVALLGALAYVGILALWLWGEVGQGPLVDLAPVGLFGLALTGTLFSLYLTYLEPFVIGAICDWCLASAVTITAICVLAAGPVFSALRQEE